MAHHWVTKFLWMRGVTRSPPMPFEKVWREQSDFGNLRDWGRRKPNRICFFCKVTEGNRGGGDRIEGPLATSFRCRTITVCRTSHESFKTLLVSWENCSQLTYWSHWFPDKAWQSANSRHHQTTWKRLRGRNWSVMLHIWGMWTVHLHTDSKLLTANCKETKQEWWCSHGSWALSKSKENMLQHMGVKEHWEAAPNCMFMALAST